MNIDEYETSGRSRYERLATVVEQILQHGLEALSGIANRPQTQKRSKDAVSLRAKLERNNLARSGNIENEIKDLAGCRIVFYTATDLERFLQSGFWRENFEIDWRASKIHFPRDADVSDDELYQGIHYVVRLKESRTQLIEYADLAGLRCEVQLQTILNHAWSETSHDVLYKPDQKAGFGARQFDEIKKRFARVMREHLMPAGYDLQKIQEDAERLRLGRAIFDADPLKLLGESKNNNDREDLLRQIQTHLLPGLDDLSAFIPDIRQAVVAAAEASRLTPAVAKEGLLGEFRGSTASDVLRRCLEVLDELRYSGAIEDAFLALVRLWEGAREQKDRELIEGSLVRLADCSIQLWDRAGSYVQKSLIGQLQRMTPERRAVIRPLVLLIVRAALATKLQGSEATNYNVITFSRGTISASDELANLRTAASDLAKEALVASTTSGEWRSAWKAFWSGAHGASDVRRNKALRLLQLELVRHGAEFVQRHCATIPSYALQSIEDDLHSTYRRLAEGATVPAGERIDGGLQEAIDETKRALYACRDAMNASVSFVRYKTLVGFETVFVEEWDNNDLDYRKKEALRAQRIAAFADEIAPENFEEWVETVRECATTDSNDLATFPPLTLFFRTLSERRPSIAFDMLIAGGEDVQRFAPAFLPTLLNTEVRDRALRSMRSWIDDGRRVATLARALFVLNEPLPDLIRSIGVTVVGRQDVNGCFEIAHAALKHGTAENRLLEDVFVQATDVVTASGSGAIASSYLLAGDLEERFDDFPRSAAETLLRNFLQCRELSYSEQARLCRLAKRYEEEVWGLLRKRTTEAARRSWQEQYEVAPDHWYGLEKILGKDVIATFDRVRDWPEAEVGVEREKAELLANLFNDCSPNFVDGMIAIIGRDGLGAVKYICEVIRQFEGNPAIFPVCRAAVAALDDGAKERSDIWSVLVATGVLSGELGMAEAYEAKIAHIAAWKTDPDEKVRSFADELTSDLQRMATEERRRGVERRERRKRDFDDGIVENN